MKYVLLHNPRFSYSSWLTMDRISPQYQSYTWRKDIDGLRAIAVLSVLVFHAFPDWLPGGFTGVDIFFVISGFLISGIILDGITNNTFSLKTFYARRIRRIFPALILVLMACLIMGWLLLMPNEYRRLAKEVLGGAGFFSNIILWKQAGYFDVQSELKPLLHLWSLGIEEQFYIFWPLTLYLALKKRFQLLTVFLGLILVSFMINILVVQKYPSAAFYFPVTRFWELLLGGLLAYCNRHYEMTRLSFLQSIVGIACIVFSVIYLDKNLQFPGFWAVFPVIGTCLLISAGPNSFINRKILSCRLLIYIGLISYPLYLWHWPMLAFARIMYSELPPPEVRLGIILVSFLLAALTWHLLEKPIRSIPKKSIPILSGAMITTVVMALFCIYMKGIPGRFDGEMQSWLTYAYDFKTDARTGKCWLTQKDSPSTYARECVDESHVKKPLVMIWGDSHAARFYPGLRLLTNEKVRLAQFTRDGCVPVLDFGYRECALSNHFIYEKIQELKPNILILMAAWNLNYKDSESYDLLSTKLATTIQKAEQAGVSKIIVIGPVPQWKTALPQAVIKQYLDNRLIDSKATIGQRTWKMSLKEAQETDRQLKQLDFGALYFSAIDAMCDSTGCITSINGQVDGLTSWDYGHLTTQGALFLAEKLLETFPVA